MDQKLWTIDNKKTHEIICLDQECLDELERFRTIFDFEQDDLNLDSIRPMLTVVPETFDKVITEGTQGIIGIYGDKAYKFYRKSIDWEQYTKIQQILEQIDPSHLRYTIPRLYFLTNDQVTQLQTKFGDIQPVVGVMNAMDPLQPLDRQAYRYLRKSVALLQEHHVVHGDLPGNVMSNPQNNMLPVIIDFDNSVITDDPTILAMDMNTFLTHFKIERRR